LLCFFTKRFRIKMSEEKNDLIDFVNPIDPKKVAENPGLLPYAHTSGSALIKPEDTGKIKGMAMSAMYEQTGMQMDQIKEQIELLAYQARAIQERSKVSELIYQAHMAFEPRIGHVYHLYEKKKDRTKHLISLVSQEEWGPRGPYIYISSMRLLSDHTWDILTISEHFDVFTAYVSPQ
jgi:Protein of unknown function (DUF2452)